MSFWDYIKEQEQKNESILDMPKSDLDTDVWQRDGNSYTLSDEAQTKIDAVVQWVITRFGITDPVVRIVGSITSNSFGGQSDIDIHFSSNSFKPDDIDEFNKTLRNEFKNEFDTEDNGNGRIGSHPLEVYFQKNQFQDLMSVGCYDFINKQWEVGPDIKDTLFDPYSEYYKKSMKFVDKIISDIRNIILAPYEKSLVYNKSTDNAFKTKLLGDILKDLTTAAKLFTDIRKKRTALSEPKSKEDALKNRNDQNWHIADASFKLLDRFGYLSVLKTYTQLAETRAETTDTINTIIKSVTENITNNKMITDSERQCFVKLTETDVTATTPTKYNIWVDDIRPVPSGYIGFKSVNSFIEWFENNGVDKINVIDLDHDAGDYYMQGGDYVKVLDYLEMVGAENIKVRLHSSNPRGVQVMRQIIRKNGWTEIYDIVKESDIDEGFKSALAGAALAAAAVVPGMASPTVPKDSSSKPNVVQQVKAEPKYAGLSYSKTVNLLATITYNEAMLDWLKNRNDDSLIAILNVIDNRAGGDAQNYTAVISANGQFVSAKHVKGGYTDANYIMYNPSDEAKADNQQISPSQKKCWDLCNTYAKQLMTGTLKHVIGDRNMIGNEKKDNAQAWEQWGKYCDFEVGSHTFGYQAKHDGYKKYNKKKPANLTHDTVATEYIVKAGDSLWGIAKANGTTVQKIKTTNGLKSDTIKPGQKLKV